MAAVEETERGYGGIIRQSLGVARGVLVERARGLAGVRWPGCPSSARHRGDESTVTRNSVHDHQLSTCRLKRGDGDGQLCAAVVRLVYSGQHAEHR